MYFSFWVSGCMYTYSHEELYHHRKIYPQLVECANNEAKGIRGLKGSSICTVLQRLSQIMRIMDLLYTFRWWAATLHKYSDSTLAI